MIETLFNIRQQRKDRDHQDGKTNGTQSTKVGIFNIHKNGPDHFLGAMGKNLKKERLKYILSAKSFDEGKHEGQQGNNGQQGSVGQGRSPQHAAIGDETAHDNSYNLQLTH